MKKLGVAFVTNLRSPVCLGVILNAWREVSLITGAPLPVSIACAPQAVDRVKELAPWVITVPHAVDPENFSIVRQASYDALPEDHWVLSSDDDVLPVVKTWTEGAIQALLHEDAISAARLVCVSGQRWSDWAYIDSAGLVRNLPYDETHPKNYITGAAQVIAPSVRHAVKMPHLAFHRGGDIGFCNRARELGFELMPPTVSTPLLLHMDRLPSRPGDPERNHIPLL